MTIDSFSTFSIIKYYTYLYNNTYCLNIRFINECKRQVHFEIFNNIGSLHVDADADADVDVDVDLDLDLDVTT